MTAPLLFNMFKTKTKYPLHSAIRLRREDVVFLYLIEFNQQVLRNVFITVNASFGACGLNHESSSKFLSMTQVFVKRSR